MWTDFDANLQKSISKLMQGEKSDALVEKVIL